MKNLFTNKIIQQAITLGFDLSDISSELTIAELNSELLEFFQENADKLEQLEDECEVNSSGRSQYVNHGDFTSSGEIINWRSYKYDAADTKINHSDYLMIDADGQVKQMNLFCYVGENDLNAPTGYHYDERTKSHVMDEE